MLNKKYLIFVLVTMNKLSKLFNHFLHKYFMFFNQLKVNIYINIEILIFRQQANNKEYIYT